VVAQLGDAEVEQLDALASGHLGIADQVHVVGLEVAVHDAHAVGSAQGAGDLPGDDHRAGRGQPAALAMALPRATPGATIDALLQALALQELHDDEGAAVGGKVEVVDLDDARVADGVGGPGLVEEAAHHVLVARVLG
jgi:hypothetical protein